LKNIKERDFIMKIVMKSLVVALFLNSICLADNSKITQIDLDTLVSNKEWREVIYKAKDIPPSQRSERWNSSVIISLKLMLDELKYNGLIDLKELEFVFLEYPSFLESQEIIPQLKAASLALLQSCHEDNFQNGNEEYCTSFFTTHFNKLPQDSDYLLKAGEYIRRAAGNVASLPFFERSVSINNSSESCTHNGLYTAADGVFRSPTIKKNIILMSKDILFKHCWEYYKDELTEDTIYGKGVYLENVCRALKEKSVKLPKNNKC
jgi:hypothetical protein